jgi:hypothetical protein
VIPFRDHQGREAAIHYRQALDGPQRFFWRKKDQALPYGLDRLEEAYAVGWVLLVEGESDCWTGWLYGIPTLGLPGKTIWQSDFAPALARLQVYVWQEPGAEDFSERIGRDIPSARIIRAPDGVKDINEAHQQGLDVAVELERWKAEAQPVTALLEERRAAALAREAGAATRVLAAPQPLVLVAQAARVLGYGGDAKPLLLAYLALTSRLLAMRVGAMPVHLVLGGSPSSGKSFVLSIVLRLLPESGYHVIDAGSPRALIYDTADLRHRALVFGEADSLPAGEDNPAASAVRNLCTDHQLHYQATVRDDKTGGFVVKEVRKDGPTVLVTTSVRQLGEQMESRLFRLEVPDDQESIRQALLAQAAVELRGAPVPDAALIACQAYLQRLTPWEVVVPFANELAWLIGRRPAAPRVRRDYARLISLIKAHAVLCHQRRQRDASGRLVATVEDYAAVFTLGNELYQHSVTGSSSRIRVVVEAVRDLRGSLPVRVVAVAKRLGINKMAATRRVSAAIDAGFLVNRESRRGQPADLELGNPLPAEDGLPTPAELGGNAVTALTGADDTPSMPVEEGEDTPTVISAGEDRARVTAAEAQADGLLAFRPAVTDKCPAGHTPLVRGGLACPVCSDARCVRCGAWMGTPAGAFCAACRAGGAG